MPPAPPPRRYYWPTQVLAWSLYGAFNLVLFRIFVPKSAGAVPAVLNLTIAAVLLGASHLLRQLIGWRGWLARPS